MNMENRLNITCNEAIKKLKAIGTALTINWNSTYEKHVPIFFDFNYPRVNEGGICMDDITELFPRIAINMRNFKGPKSEIIDDNVFITTMKADTWKIIYSNIDLQEIIQKNADKWH